MKIRFCGRSLLASLLISSTISFGSAGEATSQTAEGVKFGVLNDLTGSFADLGGQGSIVAAQMAIDDFGGEVLGKPIALVSADSQNKPDIASATARQWFDADGVDVILDPVPSSVALSIQELARDRKKIVIVASSGIADFTGKACSSTSFQWAYDTVVLASGTASTLVKEGLQDWYFVTADVAFGHSLSAETQKVVKANGGNILGEVRHPYFASDFSSFLLQAQGANPDIIALANSGADTTNAIKQAFEFGVVSDKLKVAAMLAFITDVKSVGLEQAQGLYLTESFYWDMDDETRAWSARFAEKMGGKMPSMAQAAIYSGVSHYLKAVKEVGSKDAVAVAEKMRELPVNDFMIKDGKLRKDGRIVRDFYLFQVKTPAESTGSWDLYKLVRKIPAEEIVPAVGATGCKDN
ncbi:ABC transporter substrate-binding protein [Tianweitania sediminis]|uniref:ABC transporter substrate-binding protein n=1 Tax=Tianweitania sediminis TaxID=1502156 RepID=A0A8J7RAK5_9HYPH|nr:ABC transporter substrate-binding protein [Tianweitania sediminis]MBP0441462.1 ABC transporter substrate-binding protein [Tianweitania sediminis]